MSLPTRECGLKLIQGVHVTAQFWSLPTRECGLKLLTKFGEKGNAVSLPTRECGLKLLQCPGLLLVINVTPYAGVWIETCIRNTG